MPKGSRMEFDMEKLKKYIAPILLFAAAVIWGVAFTAQKSAAVVPPLTLGAARSILATLFLIILIPVLDKVQKNGRMLVSRRGVDFTKTELVGGIICGAFLSLASLFQQIGLGDGTDAGKASFITALYVVIVPIYGLFIKKRAPFNVWCGVAVAVVGFYLLCIKGDFTVSPSDLMVFVCAFIFALQIMAIDRFSPSSDGVRLSCIQFLTASVLNSIAAIIFESPIDFALIGTHILPIIYLGVMSSGIAYTLQIIGQKGTNPAVASVILSLESVFGVIASAIVLKEKMTPREYIGCAVVFVAVILAQLDLGAIFSKKAKNEQK